MYRKIRHYLAVALLAGAAGAGIIAPAVTTAAPATATVAGVTWGAQPAHPAPHDTWT